MGKARSEFDDVGVGLLILDALEPIFVEDRKSVVASRTTLTMCSADLAATRI
jgi:hypothetical protein